MKAKAVRDYVEQRRFGAPVRLVRDYVAHGFDLNMENHAMSQAACLRVSSQSAFEQRVRSAMFRPGRLSISRRIRALSRTPQKS